jgi:hypothetical protein
MSVLVRVSQCERGINQVSCGLLFKSEAGLMLLVGTDVTTLAMVLSKDPELINRYCISCDELSLDDYFRLPHS